MLYVIDLDYVAVKIKLFVFSRDSCAAHYSVW
jgi:protein-disulfide isomerase